MKITSKCNQCAERPTPKTGRPFFIVLSVLAILFLRLLTPVFAQPALDEETKAVCNKVMLNIYKSAEAGKAKHFELADFGEKNLFENEYGIYAIVYQAPPSEKTKAPFELGLTIVPNGDKIFQDQGAHAFNLEFPFLGLKFAGYVKKGSRHRYDIFKVLKDEGILLSDHQQKFMPLRVFITTEKPEYKVKEPIKFQIEVKNVSMKHMWVYKAKNENLYCLFNNQYWTEEINYDADDYGEKIILQSGESMKRTLVGPALRKPQEVEIYCSYNMILKGVKPAGTLKLNVVQ